METEIEIERHNIIHGNDSWRIVTSNRFIGCLQSIDITGIDDRYGHYAWDLLRLFEYKCDVIGGGA